MSEAENRQVFRIYVDVLATPAQAERLSQLLGETICAAPDDHAGPCRLAWSMGTWTEEDAGDLELEDWTSHRVDFLREDLAKIPVWDADQADESLGVQGMDWPPVP